MRLYYLPPESVAATAGDTGAVPCVRELWFGPGGRELAALVGCYRAARLSRGRIDYRDDEVSGSDPEWERGDGAELAKLDLSTGRVVAARTFARRDGERPPAPAVSPDLRRIAWCDEDRDLVVVSDWDGGERLLDFTFPERCGRLAFSPGGDRLAALVVRGSDIDVTLGLLAWDLAAPPTLRPANISRPAVMCVPSAECDTEEWLAVINTPIRALVYSPGGARLGGLRVNMPPAVVWWDGATLELGCAPWRLPGGVTQGSGCLAFSPQGDRLAASADRTVAILDGSSGAVLARWRQSRVVRGLAIHPAGNLIATADGTPAVRLFDAAAGAKRAALDFGAGPATAVAFAPDGLTLAVGYAGGRIVVCDVDHA